MDDHTQINSGGVTSAARAVAVDLLRPALGLPDPAVEAFVDASAVLIWTEHRQAAFVLLRNITAGHPLLLSVRVWRALVAGLHRNRRTEELTPERPDWATAENQLTDVGPVVFSRDVFDLGNTVEVAAHASVDVWQFDAEAPVVLVEVSAAGMPVRLEPDEARQFAGGLAEAADLVDAARGGGDHHAGR